MNAAEAVETHSQSYCQGRSIADLTAHAEDSRIIVRGQQVNASSNQLREASDARFIRVHWTVISTSFGESIFVGVRLLQQMSCPVVRGQHSSATHAQRSHIVARRALKASAYTGQHLQAVIRLDTAAE